MKAAPRVTFCINELDIGGAEKALVRIAQGLSLAGWQVRVISLRDLGPLAVELQQAGIPVTALGCGGFADVRTFFRLRRELRNSPVDVVMCFLHQANIYGRLAAKFAGGPAVVSGIRVADRRRWVVLTDRMTRGWSSYYIAVSRHVAEIHAKLCGIPAANICAIRNGVDLPDEGQLPETQTRPKHVLLAVGRLTEQKNPLCLLDAFDGLPDDVKSPSTLKFVGDGPLKAKLAAEIQRRSLQQQVQLLGQRDDVPELMRTSTVLALSSLWEGMPNVVLEAMANGLPVVASNVDGVRELIDHNVTGWLVPPADPAALAITLAAALSSPEQRSAVADSAQVLIAESFTWNAVVSEYDRVLRLLLPE